MQNTVVSSIYETSGVGDSMMQHDTTWDITNTYRLEKFGFDLLVLVLTTFLLYTLYNILQNKRCENKISNCFNWQVLVFALLYNLAIAIGAVLLYIPGILIAIAFSQTLFIIADGRTNQKNCWLMARFCWFMALNLD